MQPLSMPGCNLSGVRLSANSKSLLKLNDLMEICSFGAESKEVEDLILTKPESEWNTSDAFGRTALHYAAMQGRESVCQTLLKYNFNKDTQVFQYSLFL